MPRVLLIFPGALGDVLLLAPALSALAECDARLELSVQRALGPLVRALCRRPYGDALLAALGPAVDGTVMGSLFSPAVHPALRRWLAGADVVHAWVRPDLATALAACPADLGVAAVRFHTVERGDGAVHASVAYAAALAVTGALAAPALALDAALPSSAWTGAPAGRLVLHPGAGSVAKRWSAAGFRRVADGWAARGGEVTILLGPAETDAAGYWCGTGHRVIADLELLDAARWIASAPRFVGNDAGISHLAGALDRVGAVLFGPTGAERWRPLGGALAAFDARAADAPALAAAVLAHLAVPLDGDALS